MKIVNYISVLFVTLFLATSCIEDPEFRGVSNFKIDEVNKEKISFNLDVSAYNPNGYNLKVRKSNFKLYLNDNYIGNAHLLRKYKMKRKTTTLDSVPVEIFLEKGILMPLMKIIVGGTAELRLEGVLKASFVGIPVRKHIQQTRKVNLKDLNLNLGQFLDF